MTGQGILPSQAIGSLIETGAISAAKPMLPGQVQPASLDLRLGARVFRVRASFMPGPGATTAEQIERFVLHTIDLSHGAVLETGCVYVAEVEEHLALPADVRGFANPKSSTGRARRLHPHDRRSRAGFRSNGGRLSWPPLPGDLPADLPDPGQAGLASVADPLSRAWQGMSPRAITRARRCCPWTSRAAVPLP